MKLGNKIQFGVNAVVAGQKKSVVNAMPQLIVNSTQGKFSITGPVSKALGVAVGENVMFLNNIQGVENAIQARLDDVVNYANENGIDIETREGQDALLNAFTQWYIAKGVLQYDSKGNPVMAAERYTKEDKKKYLDEHHAASGSKTATTSSATGIGCTLNFTDNAIWQTLKNDLGDEATKKNRFYDVLLDDAESVDYFNGKDNVKIMIYPIQFAKDSDPIIRNSSK